MTTSELQLQPNNLDASVFNHIPFYWFLFLAFITNSFLIFRFIPEISIGCVSSEENVYFLCKKLCSSEIADAQGSDLFVVFISNDNKQARIFLHFFFFGFTFS